MKRFYFLFLFSILSPLFAETDSTSFSIKSYWLWVDTHHERIDNVSLEASKSISSYLNKYPLTKLITNSANEFFWEVVKCPTWISQFGRSIHDGYYQITCVDSTIEEQLYTAGKSIGAEALRIGIIFFPASIKIIKKLSHFQLNAIQLRNGLILLFASSPHSGQFAHIQEASFLNELNRTMTLYPNETDITKLIDQIIEQRNEKETNSQ